MLSGEEILITGPAGRIAFGPVGSVADHTERSALTGRCRMGWRAGSRRTGEDLHPHRVAVRAEAAP